MSKVKPDNTEVTFTGFGVEETKHFNDMNAQCKRKKIAVPDVKDGEVKTTLYWAREWLLYQGRQTSPHEQFKLFHCFNQAYNKVKWEQESNNVKIGKYV